MTQLALTPLFDQGATIYVFGSRARGDHKKFSDLDLLIDGDRLARSDIAAAKEALENSNLPIKVDLVWKKDLADSYRTSVEKDKKLIENPKREHP